MSLFQAVILICGKGVTFPCSLVRNQAACCVFFNNGTFLSANTEANQKRATTESKDGALTEPCICGGCITAVYHLPKDLQVHYQI